MIAAISLKDSEYMFDDATGDIYISREKALEIDSDSEYVIVDFVEEPEQTHFPKYKVHKGYHETRLEYVE